MATAIKDKVEDVASSVASTAEEAWDSTRHAASSVASTAEEAWDSTRQAASAVAHTAENAWGDMTGLMRRYPFGTLCVGIGIGFLLSRLLEVRGTRDFRRWGSDLYDKVRDHASDAASKLHT